MAFRLTRLLRCAPKYKPGEIRHIKSLPFKEKAKIYGGGIFLAAFVYGVFSYSIHKVRKAPDTFNAEEIAMIQKELDEELRLQQEAERELKL